MIYKFNFLVCRKINTICLHKVEKILENLNSTLEASDF